MSNGQPFSPENLSVLSAKECGGKLEWGGGQDKVSGRISVCTHIWLQTVCVSGGGERDELGKLTGPVPTPESMREIDPQQC